MKNAFLNRNCQYLLLLVAFSFSSLTAQNYQKTALGVKTKLQSMDVEVQFYNPTIVRVLKSPEGVAFKKESLSVIKKPQQTKFTIQQQGDVILLKSEKLKVAIDVKSGKVSFNTLSGASLLSEAASGATFTDFNDAGSKTYSINQLFALDKNESIYGLGQQQRGKLSLRNAKINMVQGNVDDYVPFLVSTKGYGLFWDNYSPTVFEDKPESTSFKSEVGDCIDYYFVLGGNIEGSIAGMRELSGQAPMFPLWAFGYWQSKERYKSQNELVGVVTKYRELGVPLDGIIQDWQYWGNNYLWNAMEFLNTEFPQPKKMVDDIHNMNAHVIISIWNSFGPQTKQFKEMQPKGMLLNFGTWPQSGVESWPPNRDYPSGVQPYDPYNPEARDIYWKYLNKGLFSVGIDGWWMDSSEPDHMDFKASDFDIKTYLGSFRKVRNAFPLMTVGGVSEHQRAASADKRIFILTRSAFAGQQRYGANTWSGDVNSSWQSLRNQIPAGLNFSMSAIPYWNTDIGGFFAGAYKKGWGDGTQNPSFQELYVRWLQFGAFTPMMRSHGTDIPREIYNFGKKGEIIYDAIAKTIDLRYSLLPYIYSAAWDITNSQSTMMRALVMDFNDKKVVDMNNEYLFGKSILVAPVVNAQYTPETIVKSNEETGWNKNNDANGTKSQAVTFTQAKSTKVYLPEGTAWYDFWTNEKMNGGQEIEKATTIDEIPLYIKAGSIIPFGPKVQFATEKKWDALEIRVYPGANGEFTLYEDENDNYNYEKGAYSTIKFKWNEKFRTLTIGKRNGSFKGMLASRTFNIVFVDANKKAGIGGSSTFDKKIIYNGKATTVKE
ncbi:alpha-D-xyloside xylohydrolase [Flavobacterium glycines]|uniref:Alpha-D-xyloside xylohydrolase n=1 Tax=Flavobacterium glycines TaxID=551990 RepID=A0A1B9DSI0_9FLAO|nr:TIM-barrel domain-containing protein [Flavobacterium glycines]OCB72630.1 xylosidase [Flavobacterium glycines]SDI80182.1 alpha-D-xyloside xylohydrolase [Flavobacterium glycines]